MTFGKRQNTLANDNDLALGNDQISRYLFSKKGKRKMRRAIKKQTRKRERRFDPDEA